MIQKFMYCLVCLLSVAPAAVLPQSVSTSAGDRISVSYSQVPLFKNTDFNQLMKLTVYIPQGKDITYKNFQLLLDPAAVQAIEKMEVIVRDERQRSFLAGATFHGSVKQVSPVTNIPVNIPLHQGWNTIWFGASLKANADIDNKVSIKLKSITTEKGYVYTVSLKPAAPANYTQGQYRLGIAIRKAWDDSVHTYRIPGITTTDKGTLIAVYDIRYKHSGDLPANIDVGMSRSNDGGRSWEPMKVIMDMGAPHENNGIGDPAILFDPVTKKIWVAALW
ncbi:MAG TPA: BNR-repeat neuraminidase N-terminal domain-containing protein, partial [Chitinophagaceae bacterium]|nr:BNR-repeat neuraminidase N-terminal domain-containing protein [Chitinophagaceae bacterium]